MKRKEKENVEITERGVSCIARDLQLRKNVKPYRKKEYIFS